MCDSERAKLSEMLRTSMTGGMSRVLTSGLRTFLLEEKRGLANTLSNMRSNINACRRTRAEVDDARRLEAEISRVYEAGQEMFNRAVHATEQAAQEAVRRIADGEEEVRKAHAAVETAHADLESAKGEGERARDDLNKLKDALKRDNEHLRRLEAGRRLQQRIERTQSEIEAVRQARGWRSEVSGTNEIDALRRKAVRGAGHRPRRGASPEREA